MKISNKKKNSRQLYFKTPTEQYRALKKQDRTIQENQLGVEKVAEVARQRGK